GAEVDFLVAGSRFLDRRLVLGKRRRVEDDRVEALVKALQPAQLVEHVSDAGIDRDAVARRVLPDAGDRVLGYVERDRLLTVPAEHEGEAAVVAETVQTTPARVLRGGP